MKTHIKLLQSTVINSFHILVVGTVNYYCFYQKDNYFSILTYL